MIVRRAGIALSPRAVWAAGWALWLATAALVPIPPWRAADVLAREEAAAQRLARDPALVSLWSADLGDTVQQQALGPGWGAIEGGATRRFRRPRLPTVEVRFDSPPWPEAHVTLQAGPLEPGRTAHIVVLIDGQARGAVDMEGPGSVRSLPLGALPGGRHRLTLEITPAGAALAGVAVGTAPVSEPARNSGFVQWVPVGLDERPAFFPSAAATAPAGTEVVERWGLRGWYGFGVGPPVGRASAVLEAVHGLVSAALIAIVTGLGYATLFITATSSRLVLAPLFSFTGLAVVFGALRVLGLAPSPAALAAGLALVGGLPLLRPARGEPAIVTWRALVPAVLALIALVFFAARVVPPLDDQDLEVQATASALARRGTPMTVTDRGTRYFFAHPPVLHVFVAGSFTLSGRIGRVGDAEALAIEAQRRGVFVEPRPGDYPPPYYDLWQRLLERFFTEPELWPTRQVNVVLAAIAVGWLAELGAVLAGSSLVGVLVALVLATFPEFLVRGAYGGYFAVATLSMLATIAALDRMRPGWPAAAAAAFAAISEQKGLLVPAAWLFAAPRGSGFTRFVPGLGAAVGVLAFAAWAVAIDTRTFVYDFLKVHVARRLALGDVRFTHAPGIWYPSISELWGEFAAHYGIVFTVAAAVACLTALRAQEPRVRVCAAAVLIGALVFSLTDWRQTKHLSLLAAPALLTLAAACPKAPRARVVYLALLAAMVAFNVAEAWPLLSDFSALRPSTIW